MGAGASTGLHAGEAFQDELRAMHFGEDFYTEPEVHRGVTMACDARPDYFDISSGFGVDSFCQLEQGSKESGKHPYVAPCEVEPPTLAQQFSDAAIREVPIYGGLAATTVVVGHSASASRVGDALVQIMTSRVRSSDAKIKYSKASVKADVLTEFGICTLKAAMLRGSDGALVVEFRRSRGDALAFAQAYQEVSGLLCGMLGLPPLAVPVIARSPSASPAVAQSAAVIESSLEPVLDMLADGSALSAQAEAVFMLLSVAAFNAVGVAAICAVFARVPQLVSVIVGCALAEADVPFPASAPLSRQVDSTDAALQRELAVAANALARVMGVSCGDEGRPYGLPVELAEIAQSPDVRDARAGGSCSGYSSDPWAVCRGERFSDAVLPRDVPVGGLAATSLLVGQGIPASVVGSALLFYIAQHLTASRVDVDCRKLSIKADVVGQGGGWCTLKAGLFRDADNALVVEFRRMSGDMLVFAQSFRGALGSLRATLPLHAHVADVRPLVAAI